MRIGRILEIGVAVEKLEVATPLYTQMLKARPGDIVEETEHWDMRFQMCRIGNVDFELMESMVENNVIGRFVKRRGPGLHHIAFEVPDVFEAADWMKQNGVWVITDPPTLTDGLWAIFLGPKSFNGVLFELIQGLHRWVDGRELPAELETGKEGQGFPMFQGVTEIGIAVADLAATSVLYERVLGAVISETVEVDRYEVQMRVSRIGNVSLKLMQPMTMEGIIGRFIKRRGEGLHHVTLKVSDLGKAVDWLKRNGARVIDDAPQTFSSNGYAFIHPSSFAGVMFQLSEKQDTWSSNR